MDDSKQRFELLRARYGASLADKWRALDAAWRAYLAQPADQAARRELQQQVHRLSGSAPAYGYETLGLLARAADNLMQSWPSASLPPTEQSAHLGMPLRNLLDELERTGAQVEAQERRVPEPLRVLMLDGDRDEATSRLLGAHLEANACLVRRESDAELLWEALLIWPCHALVLDYWWRDGSGDEVVAMLRREPRFAHIALVCFTDQQDPQLLRAAIEAGCDAALSSRDGSARLLSVVRECVAHAERSAIRFD